MMKYHELTFQRHWLIITRVQAARTRALQHAYRRAEAAHPRENAPKVGSIRNLGLLGKDEDTRDVLSKTEGGTS